MSTEFSFQYCFHAAGQGVFTSGTVYDDADDPFDWVVDCGSTNQNVLNPRIWDFKATALSRRHLDLLCISHFDKDHVSGLGRLLSGLRVETIVIPYYTPLERLIIGSQQRLATGDYFEFLGNPVAYLLDSSASIGKIIVVGGASTEFINEDIIQERPPGLTPGRLESKRQETDAAWTFESKEAIPLPGDSPIVDDPTQALAEARGTALFVTEASLRTYVARMGVASWEFLFFHKPIQRSAISQLKDKVGQYAARHFRRGLPDLSQALQSETFRKGIRAIFAETIPQPNDVNSTSLCVYSGPLPEARRSSITIEGPLRYRFSRFQFARYSVNSESPKCSILYTGDANLKRRTDRKELHDFLTKSRRRQISVFQVPHHGSRYNWTPGAELHFYQDWSVFCANDRLKRPGHPHNEVIADLLYRNPILVNAEDGWNWNGTVHFP